MRGTERGWLRDELADTFEDITGEMPSFDPGPFQGPAECPNCGGPINFAERSKDDRTVVLCRGDCGEWSVIA